MTTIGLTFRFRIQSINEIGGSISPIVQGVLSTVPSTPVSGPQNVVSLTNGNQITVQWTAPADDGGSPIISYELQLQDVNSIKWNTLVGFSTSYIDLQYSVKNGIVKGTNYIFRFRALNRAGWSGYSPISFITASQVPN